MSNRANICQETKKTRHNGQKQKVISVFDDYGEGSIEVDKFCDKDLEILETVAKALREDMGLDSVETIINNVCQNQSGIYIEGTWYNWKEIKPVFDKVHNE